MAGEGQYINPIIESMANTANLAQKAKAQSEQARANKANEALRQTQLDQELKRIENEHQHAVDLLGLEGKRQELAANEAKIHAVGLLNDLHAKGVDFSKIFPSGQPQAGLPSTGNVQSPGSTVSVPALGDVSSDAFQSPGDALALEMARARGVSEATSQGALGAQKEMENLKANRTQQLKQLEIASNEKLKGQEIASNEKIAGMSNATRQGIASMENDLGLKKITAEYGTPETSTKLLRGAASGLVDLTPGNPREANILSTIIGNHWVPVGKKTGDALKQAETLIPVFKEMEDFADKYLPSEADLGSTRAKLEGMAQAGINKTPLLTTDAQNKFNQIASKSLLIGNGLENMTSGRMNMAMMNNALKSIGSLGNTSEQFKSNVGNLRSMYVTKTQNDLLSGAPPEQKQLIYSTLGITPDYLIDAPKTNPAGLSLDRDASIKLGQPAYK